jgi:hypothetical protein
MPERGPAPIHPAAHDPNHILRPCRSFVASFKLRGVQFSQMQHLTLQHPLSIGNFAAGHRLEGSANPP